MDKFFGKRENSFQIPWETDLLKKTKNLQLGCPHIRREIPSKLHHGFAQLTLEPLLPVLRR